jgi:hypothetical protein
MTFPHKVDYKHWQNAVSTIMRQSQARAGKYRYTKPIPSLQTQNTWKSALYAIVYRWFDPDMAADELNSATAHQVTDGDDMGMLYAQYDYAGEAGEGRGTDALLAYATVQVYHLTGDSNLLEKMQRRLSAYHAWAARQTPSGEAVWYAAELDAMAHIAQDLGDMAEHDRWQARAEAAQKTVQAHMPADLSALHTLFGKCATEAQATEIAERFEVWLSQPGSKSLPFKWLDENWAAYIGLRRYNHMALAGRLAERCFRIVENHGFFAGFGENDSPTGLEPDPIGGLVLDMLARERQGGGVRSQCV